MSIHISLAFLLSDNLVSAKKIHNWLQGSNIAIITTLFHKFDDLFEGPIINAIFSFNVQFNLNWVLKSYSEAEKLLVPFYH